jgi:hypothetical protein
MKHTNLIKRLVKEILAKYTHDCGCGCHGKCAKAPMLNENLSAKITMTENMSYHINNKKPLTENTFRYGSDAFLDLWAEARYLYSRNAIHLLGEDKKIVTETNLGEYGMYNGEQVPLDIPMIDETADDDEMEEITESEYQGKKVQLNKPKRGGSKKFYVYVRNPKTKKVKKVSFGDTTGLSTKVNNPKARKAFAARHRCGTGELKTSARYWSCRLPRYGKLLGLSGSYSGFW